MRSVVLLTVSGFVGVLLFAGPASAQDAESTDPDPGSPAGVLYELPVDGGRTFAAPVLVDPSPPDSGSSESGESGSEDSGSAVSTYRSENNFGTSSRVPGDPRGDRGAEEDGDGVVAVAAPANLGNPSVALNLLILALILAIGAMLGAAAGGRRGATG